MEEAKKQLEIHGILVEYPRMKKEIEELERQVQELSTELSPLRELKKIIEDNGMTVPQLIDKIQKKEFMLLSRSTSSTRFVGLGTLQIGKEKEKTSQ